jgi:addiction module HigA family antidote
MAEKKLATPKVGDIIREEFLEPLNITPYKLSKDIGVSTSSILDLLHNKRRVSVEMALRLSKYFGNSPQFWINLQNELDIREASKRLEKDLKKIEKVELIA